MLLPTLSSTLLSVPPSSILQSEGNSELGIDEARATDQPAMADACNPRSLAWLVKPCRPDPRREVIALPSLDITHQQLWPSAADSPAAPIASLPDDLLLECLSRVHPSSLPVLPLVCRRFSLLLDSPAFFRLRRSHGRLRRTLHAVALSDLGNLSSASLLVDSPFFAAASWAPSSTPFKSVPLEALDGSFSFSHARVVAIGRSIYVIGRGATLRYDAWTGAVASRAPTIFPRKKFAAAAIGGKILVAGGAARTSAVEEYDPVADAWRVVAEAPRQRYGCVGAATGGVFYIAGGLRVGGRAGDGGRLEAHVCAGSMDAYHVEVGAWVRGRPGAGAGAAAAVPGGGCVVGACGAGQHVYVVASHAVELSFWRWEGRARRAGGGEWERLEPPPLAVRVGLGGAVRFSCVAVGEEKLVAFVHVSVGCGGGGRWVSDVLAVEGAVLVYDIRGGEWSRGPDLPPGLRRASVACVEF